jgi:hypothetical protein
MAPRDDHLPEARVLLGGGARALVDTAVEAHGGRLLHLSRSQAIHRPGRSLAVRYAVEVSWAGGPARSETIVAVVDRTGPVPDTLLLEADGMQVGLFRYPADPRLPGLPIATVPTRALAVVGGSTPPELEAKTYRPCDRAVLRASSPEVGVRYLKVARPSKVPTLERRLRALGGRLPVPPVVRVLPDDGIVVTDGLPGVTLRDALRRGDHEIPGPEALLELVDELAAVNVDDAGEVSSPVARAEGFVEVLAALLPPSRRRLERLRDRLGPETGVPDRLVHGDLHPAQVMVDRGVVTGLLDVDDVGLGRPGDDLAVFLGHLASLAAADRSGRVRHHLARSFAAFAERVDPDELCRQTAAVLLGLATGPYRVQHAGWRRTTLDRIGLAERWARGDVRNLTVAS